MNCDGRDEVEGVEGGGYGGEVEVFYEGVVDVEAYY